jgi:hypothetical protein
MRLKFSRTKYDAALLALTLIPVWGALLWLLMSLAVETERQGLLNRHGEDRASLNMRCWGALDWQRMGRG